MEGSLLKCSSIGRVIEEDMTVSFVTIRSMQNPVAFHADCRTPGPRANLSSKTSINYILTSPNWGGTGLDRNDKQQAV
jgi:hypothetical protein